MVNGFREKRVERAFSLFFTEGFEICEILFISPHPYGEPLRRTLKGYWKLRVGDYRVVFKVEGNKVWIFAIINRRDGYKKIINRI